MSNKSAPPPPPNYKANTILDELNAAITLGRTKLIVLSPEKFMEYELATIPLQRWTEPVYGTPQLYYMGIRVVMDAPRWSCRNCGAPAEPNVCSYCMSPSEYICVS